MRDGAAGGAAGVGAAAEEVAGAVAAAGRWTGRGGGARRRRRAGDAAAADAVPAAPGSRPPPHPPPATRPRQLDDPQPFLVALVLFSVARACNTKYSVIFEIKQFVLFAHVSREPQARRHSHCEH